jgi:hypothetical protein
MIDAASASFRVKSEAAQPPLFEERLVRDLRRLAVRTIANALACGHQDFTQLR